MYLLFRNFSPLIVSFTGKGDEIQTDGDIGCCGYILMFFSVVILILFFPFSLLCSLKVCCQQDFSSYAIFYTKLFVQSFPCCFIVDPMACFIPPFEPTDHSLNKCNMGKHNNIMVYEIYPAKYCLKNSWKAWKGEQASAMLITLFQTTNFTLFQTEKVCRRQYHI